MEAVADGLVESSRADDPQWTPGPRRCGVFSEYGVACPTLRRCKALYKTLDPVETNVCDDGAGKLKPIKTCKGWSGAEHWCSAFRFPRCAAYVGAQCGAWQSLVCETEARERRLLRCCDELEGDSECEGNTYFEPRLIRTEVRDAGVEEVGDGGAVDGGGVASGDR